MERPVADDGGHQGGESLSIPSHFIPFHPSNSQPQGQQGQQGQQDVGQYVAQQGSGAQDKTGDVGQEQDSPPQVEAPQSQQAGQTSDRGDQAEDGARSEGDHGVSPVVQEGGEHHEDAGEEKPHLHEEKTVEGVSGGTEHIEWVPGTRRHPTQACWVMGICNKNQLQLKLIGLHFNLVPAFNE